MYKTKTTIQYWRGFQRTTHDLTVKLGTPDVKADLKMNTISGTMYTNFDFNREKNLRHVGGSSINTILNGGGERSIELETISGDIFLRKS